MTKNLVPRLLFSAVLVFFSTNLMAELSSCNGRFMQSNQPVHIEIDWNSNKVFVNDFKTNIESSVSYGIVTGTYTNKLGQQIFSIIGYYRQVGTFIAQNQTIYGQHSFLDIARLNCTKSFYKPFINRMYSSA